MSWNKIIGHNRIKKILQRALLEDRLPGAYCFWGDPGIGKEAMALEFSKILNCTNPIHTEDSVDSCNECKSCIEADKLNHPNIHMIYSLPTGKGSDTGDDSPLSKLNETQLEEVQEQLALKADNHYHKMTIPNAKQIKIASIREIKKKLSMTQSRGGHRCIIICNAEEMTTEASNAFLKTLEEPHERITIFLISSHPEMLLDTILSRCQEIHLRPLENQEIEKYLLDHHNIDPEKAKTIASFGQGSIQRAESFLDPAMQEARDKILKILRSVLKPRNYRIDLAEFIDEICSRKDSKLISKYLNLLIIWLNDAIIAANTNDEEQIVNKDQYDSIKKFSDYYDSRKLPEIITLVEKSVLEINSNITPTLLFLNLFLKIRKILLK